MPVLNGPSSGSAGWSARCRCSVLVTIAAMLLTGCSGFASQSEILGTLEPLVPGCADRAPNNPQPVAEKRRLLVSATQPSPTEADLSHLTQQTGAGPEEGAVEPDGSRVRDRFDSLYVTFLVNRVETPFNTYEGGSPGYRVGADFCVFSWPEKALLASGRGLTADPPSFTFVDIYEPRPTYGDIGSELGRRLRDLGFCRCLGAPAGPG